MPSSWPAWASALGASLALGAHGTAPPSVALPVAPSIVRADGNLVAAVVPGNRKGRCAEIVLWRVGHAPVTIRTIAQCDDDGVGLDSVDELALGGQTVAWQETNGGNNLELIIRKATLARPKARDVSYVENGGGAAGDPAGDWTGSLVGHGPTARLRLVDAVRPSAGGGLRARRAPTGLRDVYAERLHRIGGRVLAWGPDAVYPIWSDGKAILVRHADHTLVIVDAHGRVLWRHTAVPGLVGAAFQGSQVVTLTRTSLAVWRLGREAPVRTFALAPRARVLEDLDGGVAVLGAQGTTHLVRLADGRGATFTHAAHAQLEPQGLFLSDRPDTPLRLAVEDPLWLSFGSRSATRRPTTSAGVRSGRTRSRPSATSRQRPRCSTSARGTGKLTRVARTPFRARDGGRAGCVDARRFSAKQRTVTWCSRGRRRQFRWRMRPWTGCSAASASTGSTGRWRSARSRASSAARRPRPLLPDARRWAVHPPCPRRAGRSRGAIAGPVSSRAGRSSSRARGWSRSTSPRRRSSRCAESFAHVHVQTGDGVVAGPLSSSIFAALPADERAAARRGIARRRPGRRSYRHAFGRRVWWTRLR